MRDLEWWHWALIGLLVIIILRWNANDLDKSPSSAPPRFAAPTAKFETIAGNSVFAMVFNGEADPNAIADMARDRCGKFQQCQVLGWTDPKLAARAIPMTDREVKALAFNYSLNRTTGLDEAMWDCSRWKRPTPSECMAPAEAKPE